MSRGLGYKRNMRSKHIRRKSRIVKEMRVDGSECLLDERFRDSLSKGKVHCSCWMCSTKTKRDGYKPRDKRQMDSLDDSELDF